MNARHTVECIQADSVVLVGLLLPRQPALSSGQTAAAANSPGEGEALAEAASIEAALALQRHLRRRPRPAGAAHLAPPCRR